MGMGYNFRRRTTGQRNSIVMRKAVPSDSWETRKDQMMRGRYPGGSQHYKPWTSEEDEIVLNSGHTNVKLTKILGRSWESIRCRKQRLKGIRK